MLTNMMRSRGSAVLRMQRRAMSSNAREVGFVHDVVWVTLVVTFKYSFTWKCCDHVNVVGAGTERAFGDHGSRAVRHHRARETASAQLHQSHCVRGMVSALQSLVLRWRQCMMEPCKYEPHSNSISLSPIEFYVPVRAGRLGLRHVQQVLGRVPWPTVGYALTRIYPYKH